MRCCVERMYGCVCVLVYVWVLINYYYHYHFYYYTKHFFSHTPAGAESDLNTAAAAPSQTEVTDLNCSDHSTTSKEMARGELW